MPAARHYSSGHSRIIPEVVVKACPQCGQEIQDAAIKCRYCRTWLVPPPESQPSQIIIRQSSTNGMAIASLVLGMLWMYWIGSILAICFGYAARREIRRNPDRMDGEGMALAGIILGWVGVGTLALMIGWVAYFYSVQSKKPSTREMKTTASLQLPPSREMCSSTEPSMDSPVEFFALELYS